MLSTSRAYMVGLFKKLNLLSQAEEFLWRKGVSCIKIEWMVPANAVPLKDIKSLKKSFD